MIAGADLVVDAVARAHDPLAGLELPAICGRMRRWRASWHSPSATMTLRPLSSVFIASRKVSSIVPTL